MRLRQADFFLRKAQLDLNNKFKLSEMDGKVLFRTRISEQETQIYVYYVYYELPSRLVAKYTGQLLMDEDIDAREIQKRLEKTNDNLEAELLTRHEMNINS